MRFNHLDFLISLLSLVTMCESQTIRVTTFKRFQGLQLDKCPSSLANMTSKSACARLCVSQGNCSGFSFGPPDSLCVTCVNGDDVTNLTFDDGVDTYLKRQNQMSSFILDNNTLTRFSFPKGLSSGQVLYVRGNFQDSRGFQINVFNDTANGNVHYRFATNDTTQKVQLNSKFGVTWQKQQTVNSPFIVNQTFELHILFKSSSVISYVNRTHLNTYVNNNQSISEIRYITVGGYIFLDELSI